MLARPSRLASVAKVLVQKRGAWAMVLALSSCTRSSPHPPVEAGEAPWSEIETSARGQTLTWAMWQGDPQINRFVRTWVAPRLKERFGIRLVTVSAQGPEIVSTLMTELEADKTDSAFDLVWINGETFAQLRRVEALYGPFVETLPGSRLLDLDNPFIGRDFQKPIEGFECPWGNVQMALIYDKKRVANPPQNPDELLAWVKAHPGRFTWATEFTGLTFLKSLLIHFAGGGAALNGPFDEAKYRLASEKLWSYIAALRPHLWQSGTTFPVRLARLHQLFAVGEIDFSMSNNDAEADNKVATGTFPTTTRAYVWKTGTIQNSHYLGITKRGRHRAAALTAINFLISPEAQYEKLKPSVWGDGTVLLVSKLSEPWQARFRGIPDRERAPSREAIAGRALEEPDAEYMIRLDRDFRRRILEHAL